MFHKYINNGSDKTLVLFHGTGGDENSLLQLAKDAAPHMNHLALRGEVVTFGQRRFSTVQDESQIIDLEDMIARIPGIQRIIEILQVRYNMGELWGLGFSNGANALATLLLKGKPMFKKALLFRPIDVEVESNVNLNQMEILIHSGIKDDITPQKYAYLLEKRLINHNGNVTHKSFDVDHWMRKNELEALKQWFQEH